MSSKRPKILILGSGALKIGEAGEFDYSGSQAAKALKEEGISTVIINPNIATIQTSEEFADRVYFIPVTPDFVEKVIEREKPDGILLGFGGQTALNCGLELAKRKVFQKYRVKVFGTPVSAIEKTEDRLIFRKSIEDLGLKVPKSIVVKTMSEIRKLMPGISFPVIVRAGFSLGGLGSGVARNSSELEETASKALSLTPQILVEEYLEHWKEIEYEVVRDSNDNTLIVCNMENFDPMGVHTGESIVVAPSQTLTNNEYHFLRQTAIKVVKSLPIVGECNIQYALNPRNGDYRIIEVNARLSRSSALASKATGYPLAYIAAKLALGYTLDKLPNRVTGATTAFFEPSLDYVVVKIPRWDFLKFREMDEKLGSEMQSVGEVMAIGRNFEEAIQKAVRSLDLDYEGLISDDICKQSRGKSTGMKSLDPVPSRLYNVAYNIFHGMDILKIYTETGIDLWFLERIKRITDLYRELLKIEKKDKIPYSILKDAKLKGFSDKQIAEATGKSESSIRIFRKKLNIVPRVCQIDTLAGEFPAKTNYLYMSYARSDDDVTAGDGKKVAIIGGGPYQIGSSVEFDWCAVNSVLTAKKLGYSTIMVNCNPETVSTDYDISDKLYFEELTLERILDIHDFEKCPFIVSVGGQIPNNLSLKMASNGIRIAGNPPETIDRVENREKFSRMLDKLGIRQPLWKRLKTAPETLSFSEKIGYPILFRPSYVLSGKAMFVAYSRNMLEDYFRRMPSVVNSDYPVVVSKFISGAKEVDFDAVVKDGEIKAYAISEHIEHSGVHSGDATLVLPSFSLSSLAKHEIVNVSAKITRELGLNGPINIQYLVSESHDREIDVMVIEANIRASRSFPFVSKVMGENFINLATRAILGEKIQNVRIKEPEYYGIKVPHFSFTRLRKADPVLRVEMASTGEVASFGENVYEAYLKALLSTGITLPKKTALLSLGGGMGKQRLVNSAGILKNMGFLLYATKNTHDFLKLNGIKSKFVYKVQDKKRPNVVDLISEKKVEMVINLSDKNDLANEVSKTLTDGYLIRRAAVDANIPLFTKATIANVFVKALQKYSSDKMEVKAWDEYVKKIQKSKIKKL